MKDYRLAPTDEKEKNMRDIVPHVLYQHSSQSALVLPSNIS